MASGVDTLNWLDGQPTVNLVALDATHLACLAQAVTLTLTLFLPAPRLPTLGRE